MAKVITDESLLGDILSGAGQLADTVTPNFGPNGKNTVIDLQYDIPRVVNEGKDILPDFGLADSVENVGAVLLRDAALQTGHLNGDGTIATTIITKAIMEEGHRLITSGANPIRMREAMKRYIPQIEEVIRKTATPADTREMLLKIALGSADDEEMAEMVLAAMDVVGVNGAINVVDSQEPKNRLEAIDGIKYDYGLENMVFVNRPIKKDAYLEKPYVLLANMKITALKDIEKILRSIMEEKRPLLIIAQDVNEDVQKILAINTMRGNFSVVCAKGPGYGDTRRRNLQALALKIGAVMVEENCGLNLSDCGLEICGQVESATIDKEHTTLIGVKKEETSELLAMKEKVEEDIRQAKTTDEKEKYNTTLAILEGCVATIYAGGFIEYEMFENQHRMENTIQAVRAAAKSGIVAGGGKGYLLAVPMVEKWLAEELPEADRFALLCLKQTLIAPAYQLAENSGANGAYVTAHLLEHADEPYYGYNTASHAFEDFSKTGIWDPADTVCTAFRIGAEAAATMLTVTAAVVK